MRSLLIWGMHRAGAKRAARVVLPDPGAPDTTTISRSIFRVYESASSAVLPVGRCSTEISPGFAASERLRLVS